MTIVWLYSLVSVFVVSLISLVGLLAFRLKEENLKNQVAVFQVTTSLAVIAACAEGVWLYIGRKSRALRK